MSAKKTTITDIARSCGVGVGTVSRAINGKAGVRPEVRHKILQYIEDIGWRSTSLKGRLQLPELGPTVVVVAPLSSLERKYYSEFPRLLLERMAGDGYSPVVLYGRCRENLERCESLGPHGVVVLGVGEFQREAIRQLLQAGIRVVSVGECEELVGPVLVPDHRKAGMEAARLLLAAGHKRIGFLGGMGMRRRIGSLDEVHVLRVRQLLEGIVEAHPGLDLAADLVSDRFSDLGHLRQRLEEGRHTAWIASDEKMCQQFLHCAADLGLRVPEDVSLVGFTADLPFYAFAQDVTRFYPDSAAHVEQAMAMLQGEPRIDHEVFRADYVCHSGNTVRQLVG